MHVILKILFFILMHGCNYNNTLKMSMTPLQRGTVMDPASIYFLNEYYLIENLTVRLVEMDARIGYKLMLASEVKKENDTTYIIKIKETYFSNGEKITVEDVRRSLERARSKKSSHIPFHEIVESISTSSDTVTIALKKKVNDFMYFLTLADLSILHHSQIGKNELKVEDWEKVSSGPFIYAFENEQPVLLKNKFYRLSHNDYPEKIVLLSSRGRDSFEDFEKGLVDIGEFNLNSYEKNIQRFQTSNELRVIGNNGDMINFLVLNSRSSKFKNSAARRWIQKKIYENFRIDTKYNAVAKKAKQFFTPHVKGFVPESIMDQEMSTWSDVNTNVVPEELKNGITIKTYERAFEVTLKSCVEELSTSLGIPVSIENDVKSPDFDKFRKDGNYDAFLVITSMDQIIVGESINLYYFSDSPMLHDPSGKIQLLMDKYQSANADDVPGILKMIAIQMMRDAESIPLFYVASPFFYRNNLLNISGLDEMTYFNLWKIKIK